MAAASRGAAGKGKDPKGLYSTLGVSTDADVAEIRRAYRRLALRWHPDKNPDDPSATEQFQKISSAYEVLSDSDKREMYDTTGCIDEEELAEEGDLFGAAQDIFSAFFTGNVDDLDEEEQAMMDELLRCVGGSSPFKRGGRRHRGKKGRGRGGKRGGGARGMEDMMGEALLMAMAGGMMDMDAAPTPVCPQGHTLKRRKQDTDTYECDVCGKDILPGKRFYDCRKCDWSICQRCYKEAEEAAQEAALEEDALGDQEELLEAFCEMHTSVVRKGRRLQHKCEICEALLGSAEAVWPHMEKNHMDVIEAFMEEALEGRAGARGGAGYGGGARGHDLEEELLMEMLSSGMMPGMPGMMGMPQQGSAGGSKKSGSRKKR